MGDWRWAAGPASGSGGGAKAAPPTLQPASIDGYNAWGAWDQFVDLLSNAVGAKDYSGAGFDSQTQNGLTVPQFRIPNKLTWIPWPEFTATPALGRGIQFSRKASLDAVMVGSLTVSMWVAKSGGWPSSSFPNYQYMAGYADFSNPPANQSAFAFGINSGAPSLFGYWVDQVGAVSVSINSNNTFGALLDDAKPHFVSCARDVVNKVLEFQVDDQFESHTYVNNPTGTYPTSELHFAGAPSNATVAGNQGFWGQFDNPVLWSDFLPQATRLKLYKQTKGG